jgi:hypothetical protein
MKGFMQSRLIQTLCLMGCLAFLLTGGSAAQRPITTDSPRQTPTTTPTFTTEGCPCAAGQWYDKNRKSCVRGVCENIAGMPDGDKGGGYFAWQGTLFQDMPCQCADLDQTLNTGSAAWTITADPDPATQESRPAVTIAYPNVSWGSIPNAKWVGPNSEAFGDFTYQITFCLCRGFQNASLTLSLLADNAASVRLNGNTIGSVAGPYGFKNPPQTVSTSTQQFFHPGTNTLQVIVHNDSSVTGLNAAVSVKALRGRCQ